MNRFSFLLLLLFGLSSTLSYAQLAEETLAVTSSSNDPMVEGSLPDVLNDIVAGDYATKRVILDLSAVPSCSLTTSLPDLTGEYAELHIVSNSGTVIEANHLDLAWVLPNVSKIQNITI